MNISVSRRYARALLEVAVEQDALDEISRSLQSLSASFAESAELRALAGDPEVPRESLWAVIGKLLAQGGENHLAVGNLARLLIERRRLAALPEIARVFGLLADSRTGRLRGRVTSAVELPADSLSRLEESLERITQREVILDSRVDASLLGGVSAQLGSTVYDGSMRSQLEELRRTLKAS